MDLFMTSFFRLLYEFIDISVVGRGYFIKVILKCLLHLPCPVIRFNVEDNCFQIISSQMRTQ